MLFKSGVLAQASGSLGGLTASHNRGGMYLRNRAIPTNPNTVGQQAVRGILATLAVQWGLITQARRDVWTIYAGNTPVINRQGDSIVLTGQQMFIRCNATRMRAGFAFLDTGPTVPGNALLSAATAIVAQATDLVTVTFDDTDPWANETDGSLLVFVSRDVGPTIKYFRGPYQFAGSIDGDGTTPPTSPDATITSPFNHGSDNAVAFRLVAVLADGRISQEVFVGPILSV